FNGSNPTNWETCSLSIPATEPYAVAANWADGSGKYQTMTAPGSGIVTRYMVEFWCYTTRDSTLPMDSSNNARMYRITVYAVGEGGRARVMLRSTIKET